MNISGVNDVTVEAATKGTANSLGPRLITGVIMAICALAVVGAGGETFLAVVSALIVIVAFEWIRMSCRARSYGSMVASVFALGLVSVAFALCGVVGAFSAGATGVVLVGVIARVEGNRQFVVASGLAVFILSLISICWLRQENATGAATIYWLFAVVWATDSGAYLVGTLLGGARIAPRISPHKTWAGGIGGLAFGTFFGVILAIVLVSVGVLESRPNWIIIAVAGAVVSVFAQIGDFTESATKRHFAVKDSGAWLPGHGGALDRLDSLIFVSPLLAFVIWLVGGSGVLLWGGG